MKIISFSSYIRLYLVDTLQVQNKYFSYFLLYYMGNCEKKCSSMKNVINHEELYVQLHFLLIFYHCNKGLHLTHII